MATGDKHEKPCPNCGHCPTCGKSNWNPQPQWPWGRYPWPYTQPIWVNSPQWTTASGPKYTAASAN